MLKVKLAEKFIEKLTAYTKYNINIMNDKGIIIASRDITRVGNFHEIAYQLLSQGKDIIEVETDDIYVGTLMGVNMVFLYKNKAIGVVGVTGKPDEVREIALIIRMSIETMMEYEISQEKSYKRQGNKAYFLNCLLYGETDKNELNQLCTSLGYDNKIIRIPILIKVLDSIDLNCALSRIKKSIFHSKQDISVITRDENILIYKHFKVDEEALISEYKYNIEEYIGNINELRIFKENTVFYYIGSAQKNIENYSAAYQHSLWILENIKIESEKLYFYDFIGEYMKSRTPFMEIYKIFNIFDELIDEKTKQNIVDLIDPMAKHSYNLMEASKSLYIHRNTLVFRLNKIKAYFNINPTQNDYEKDFLNYLSYYLKFK